MSIATSVITLFVYACYTCFFQNPYNKPAPDTSIIRPAAPGKRGRNDLLPGFAETITAREYHISMDTTRQLLQSPNRKHNLRAYYRPGLLTVQNRANSSNGHFSVSLQNQGIRADGQLIGQPNPSAAPEIRGNRLLIRHSNFSEEFINNEDGVRQNFIVEQAPAGTSELEVALTARGVRIQDSGKNELLFLTENNKTHPRLVYRDLKCWDAHNRPLTALLTAKQQQILITVDVRNAAYPVTIDPIIVNGNPGNTNALLESDQAGALLGFSVASAGDVNADGYSDVLAGAPHYDNGEDEEGAAFLYYGSANGLSPTPTVFESNQPHAEMGYSVSGAGDINADGFSDIALAAPFYDKGETDEGVVFVHLGSAKGVKPVPAVILERDQFEAQFGISVALAGDVNADGFSDLLVGANAYDQGEINEGAAFVFYGSKIGISPLKQTALESNQANAMMGSSVAGAGDVNADGYGDVVIGATFYDQGQAGEGAAFVYLGSAQGVVDNPVVIQGNQAHAHMGSSVTSAGDVNGDSYADIIVGAPHYDKLYANQGLANVYFGSATGINVNTPIGLAGKQMNEEFGRSVACAGDVNGDSFADIIIAGRTQGKGLADEGAASLFNGFPAGVNKQPASTFRSNQANALFGQSIASAGDVNGDGFSDLVIGAYLYDAGQSNEGIAMIWHGGASGINAANAAALHANQPESAFGYSVSGAGDVDGDGYDDVIVGAPHYDNGQSEEGVAFVFRGTPSGISKTASNMMEADQADAGFGTSVSAAGDVNGDGFGDIVVGAMHYENGEDEEGAAYVYLGSPTGIQAIPIVLESNKTGAWFGCAASHGGDLNGDGFSEIVIGAMNYSNGQSEEGALYVFFGSPAGPGLAGMHIVESDVEDARLGNSVAHTGDLNGDGRHDIVAGAYSYGENDAGALFIGYGNPDVQNPLTAEYIKGINDQAQFGWDVSGAGDINGDGFHDVIVGAHAYDNGDGAADLYYGSTGGLTQANVQHLYAHDTGMAGAMGESVAGAGDLNGDGYGDVAVGEPWFIDENSSILTGLALIYYGSPTGVDPGPQRIMGNLNDSYDFFGWSVAAAGDVDADGYSDMIVGSPNFSAGQMDADAAFVYYGNNGPGLRNNLRLYNSDLSTLLDNSQKTKQEFGIGLSVRPFTGTGRGKLVWETAASGQGFSQGVNDLITGSTAFTGMQKGYGMLPAELKSKIAKQGLMTNLRARVRYDPSQALTGQVYGPWRYLSGSIGGISVSPLPAKNPVQTRQADAIDTYVYPNPASSDLNLYEGSQRKVLRSAIYTNTGKLVRCWKNHPKTLHVSTIARGTYILRLTFSDSTESSHTIILD